MGAPDDAAVAAASRTYAGHSPTQATHLFPGADVTVQARTHLQGIDLGGTACGAPPPAIATGAAASAAPVAAASAAAVQTVESNVAAITDAKLSKIQAKSKGKAQAEGKEKAEGQAKAKAKGKAKADGKAKAAGKAKAQGQAKGKG